MQTSGHTADSWQLGISHGGDLTFCLYVRDRLGLNPDTSPWLASLAPPVKLPGFPRITESDRPDLEAQWLQWWGDRLRAHWDGRPQHFDDAADSFPELAASRQLYELVTTLADDARRWAADSKREFFEIFKSARIHSARIAALGNQYWNGVPFALSVTCLPVSGELAWRADPRHALVSYAFYADHERFLDWLELAIAAAAEATP